MILTLILLAATITSLPVPSNHPPVAVEDHYILLYYPLPVVEILDVRYVPDMRV